MVLYYTIKKIAAIMRREEIIQKNIANNNCGMSFGSFFVFSPYLEFMFFKIYNETWRLFLWLYY